MQEIQAILRYCARAQDFCVHAVRELRIFDVGTMLYALEIFKGDMRSGGGVV